ncbi:MAG: hypothetical protein ACXVZV_09740 [Terriglobales bacterium]
MSANVTFAGYATAKPRNGERIHRMLVYLAAGAAVSLILFLAIYGFDYYWLSSAERPFSMKHELLKPSGRIGIKLGMLGVGLFLVIFLYALRKKIKWLSRQGATKHWLDFHVVAGVTAPLVIAFHSAFKFHGIAGVAFWIMLAVALSGFIGRYVYAQIPRSLSAAEASLKELESWEGELAKELEQQRLFSQIDLARLLRVPTAAQVRSMPLFQALLQMVAFDLLRPFQIARLRRKVLSWSQIITSMGGLFRTSNPELEYVIGSVKRKSNLAKRVAFLDRSQQVFHLWHVIHRPFSYSFAVLAVMHIVVVIMLGFL